jgi:hypothetical protein
LGVPVNFPVGRKILSSLHTEEGILARRDPVNWIGNAVGGRLRRHKGVTDRIRVIAVRRNAFPGVVG